MLSELSLRPRPPTNSVPGNHLLHPHFHLSLVISSPFWGHLQPHLHLLLVPLLPVSEMDNLQNQKRKTNPQHCDPGPHVPHTVDLEKFSPQKAGTKDDNCPTLRPRPPVGDLSEEAYPLDSAAWKPFPQSSKPIPQP